MLDDIERMEELDSNDMLKILENFPEQIEEVVERSEINLLPFQPDNIVVTGMGGSAIVGDTLKSFLANRIQIPIYVNRDYTLPSFVGENTLLIVVSYSGNTEETLSAAREGLKRDAKVVAISSDGELEDISREEGLVLIKAPTGYPPRAAFAFLFIPVLQLLSELLIYDSEVEILDSVSKLKELRDRIKIDVETEENEAKKLAKRIHGKIPIVYGHSIYNAVANRWHTQFNENSEILSWYGAFPEMNHNEIVGWKGGENIEEFIPILLRDEKESDKINHRIELTKELVFDGKVEDMIEVWTDADTQLARILYLVYLGDYVSIYLALLRGKDPSPVDIIDELKKNL
ncbi:MAG: bifunctional phosphoglucose/phosphomannose isomerase [Candidatus Thermoplasmatota archaeon]